MLGKKIDLLKRWFIFDGFIAELKYFLEKLHLPAYILSWVRTKELLSISINYFGQLMNLLAVPSSFKGYKTYVYRLTLNNLALILLSRHN